jgi:hypothetical protein
MPFRSSLLAALSAAAMCVAGPALAESFVTFQIQGALSLDPVRINNAGTVAGIVVLQTGQTRSFVRSAAGAVDVFDVGGHETFATGLNDDGTVVGYYQSGSTLHGFSRSPAGVISEVTLGPGADFVAPAGLNNTGTIVGLYRQTGQLVNLGFLAGGGNLVTISPPAGSSGAVANAVNDSGVSTGFFEGVGLPETGFVRAADGTITTFDAVAYAGPYYPQTDPIAVNNAGTVAGTFKVLKCIENCRTQVAKGFLRDAAGQITTFTVGGKLAKTWLNGLNNLGQATGSFDAPRQAQQGYVRNADGSVVTFAVPTMTLTDARSINDQGVVAGSANKNSQVFGFIRLP